MLWYDYYYWSKKSQYQRDNGIKYELEDQWLIILRNSSSHYTYFWVNKHYPRIAFTVCFFFFFCQLIFLFFILLCFCGLQSRVEQSWEVALGQWERHSESKKNILFPFLKCIVTPKVNSHLEFIVFKFPV